MSQGRHLGNTPCQQHKVPSYFSAVDAVYLQGYSKKTSRPCHSLCKTGWATSRVYDSSYEGTLIGKAVEDEQKIFFDQYDAWVNNNRITSLYFEALDENWKGGFDGDNPMDKAEKHWGVYKADRTPKKLLRWNKSVTLITSLSST